MHVGVAMEAHPTRFVTTQLPASLPGFLPFKWVLHVRALVVVLLFLTGNTTQTSSPTVQQGVMGQLAENKLLLPLPTLVARMIKRSPQEWRHSGCPGATASSTCPSLPVLPLDAIHLAPAC
ncbi:hypothetical protein C0Q70_00803 [Pomacea canaliculata]|uniref:Uncharacterized protein n=1 Tax=Pomacea canaliculata TaxID=400727 RepID=A0A2T7PXP1_POMCA|nr:hypothetical protein C0Q70_00803 [Pomacea canaliculata]